MRTFYLPDSCVDLWDTFVALEAKGMKKAWQRALQTFIEAMLDKPDEFVRLFVSGVCEAVVDQGHAVPVKYPLFKDVMFPVLLEGLKNGTPHCARWLAGFIQVIYKSQFCMAALGPDASNIQLLRKALEVAPDDLIARRMLVEATAWVLDYSLHELPSGVLDGNDGASVEGCLELEKTLLEFIDNA